MNISELNDSTGHGQPNFSGIQTLITPTSQYVFPPSLTSPTNLLSQQATSTTTNTTTTSEGQIQKYPPFIGQAVTSLQSQPGVHMVNSSCRLGMSVSTPVASVPYVITGATDATRKGKNCTFCKGSAQICVQKSDQEILMGL